MRMLKEGAEDQVEQPSFTGYVAGSKKNTASAKENTGPVDYRNIIANNLAEAEKRAKAGVASAIQLSRNGMPRPEAIERRRQAEMALASGGAADDDVPPLE